MAKAALAKAFKARDDEFYTRMIDIEKELRHYEPLLRGKTIYCNCDSEQSNFVKYFQQNKERLGIKELMYSSDDFRADHNLKLLDEADIVITNPPFSLFREYINCLITHKKEFLVIGSLPAIQYANVYDYWMAKKLHLGVHIDKSIVFDRPFGETKATNISWFTTLNHGVYPDKLELTKLYTPEEYPKYDNYDAIEVGRTKHIPKEYKGVMGVPISFISKYNPAQFEIVGVTCGWYDGEYKTKVYTKEEKKGHGDLNATAVLRQESGLKVLFTRLLIKHKEV